MNSILSDISFRAIRIVLAYQPIAKRGNNHLYRIDEI